MAHPPKLGSDIMRYASAVLGLSIALLTGACGSDGNGGTGPGPVQESVAGDYAGVMGGTVEGVAMSADFSLTLNQSDGQVSGSYAMSGTLTDGIDSIDFTGSGTLSGTVATGANPAVNITITPGFCPDRQANFSGTYDSANRRLTMIGSVEFFDNSCQVLLSYPMNMVLFR